MKVVQLVLAVIVNVYKYETGINKGTIMKLKVKKLHPDAKLPTKNYETDDNLTIFPENLLTNSVVDSII